VDYGNNKIAVLLEELQNDFKILYNEDVSLLTILHYNNEIIGKTLKDYKVLLEQRSRNNVRFVVK
jgi:aspartate kinase